MDAHSPSTNHGPASWTSHHVMVQVGLILTASLQQVFIKVFIKVFVRVLLRVFLRVMTVLVNVIYIACRAAQ